MEGRLPAGFKGKRIKNYKLTLYPMLCFTSYALFPHDMKYSIGYRVNNIAITYVSTNQVNHFINYMDV